MVEVTTDGGATWQEAELSEVPSNRTWRLWRYDHVATEAGIRRVSVRATDGNGDLQPEIEQDPLPDGATGLDRDWFEVLDAEGESVEVGGQSITAASRKWLDGDFSPEATSDRGLDGIREIHELRGPVPAIYGNRSFSRSSTRSVARPSPLIQG